MDIFKSVIRSSALSSEGMLPAQGLFNKDLATDLLVSVRRVVSLVFNNLLRAPPVAFASRLLDNDLES